jgi:hypothetical protein
MTGLRIRLRLAKEVERRHCDVLDVRDKAVEDLGELSPTVYPLGSYLDRQKQKRRCFDVREDGVMLR